MKLIITPLILFFFVLSTNAQQVSETAKRVDAMIEREVDRRTHRQKIDIEVFRTRLISFYHSIIYDSISNDNVIHKGQFPLDTQDPHRLFFVKRNEQFECHSVQYVKNDSIKNVFDNEYDCSSPLIRTNSDGDLVLLDAAADKVRVYFEKLKITNNPIERTYFIASIFGLSEARLIHQSLNYELEINSKYSRGRETDPDEITLILNNYGEKNNIVSPFNLDGESTYSGKINLGDCGDAKSMNLIDMKNNEAEYFSKLVKEKSFETMCVMNLSVLEQYDINISDFLKALY